MKDNRGMSHADAACRAVGSVYVFCSLFARFGMARAMARKKEK
jgi:hypothetical protein